MFDAISITPLNIDTLNFVKIRMKLKFMQDFLLLKTIRLVR